MANFGQTAKGISLIADRQKPMFIADKFAQSKATQNLLEARVGVGAMRFDTGLPCNCALEPLGRRRINVLASGRV
jgi:hypothetical protein